MSKTVRIDTLSAQYYDALYQFKDFDAEALSIIDIIRSSQSTARDLLDIGCGTHRHSEMLQTHFSVDGIDKNPRFLEIARQRNPAGTYVEADMRHFRLQKKYDAIISLHSSVGYLAGISDFIITLSTIALHLKPRAVVLIEPWFSPSTFEPEKASLTIAEVDGVHIARASRRYLRAAGSVVEFRYLIAHRHGFESFREVHKLSLLSVDSMLEAFESTGFSAYHDATWSNGRGLFIAQLK